jgi:hypothetical protein
LSATPKTPPNTEKPESPMRSNLAAARADASALIKTSVASKRAYPAEGSLTICRAFAYRHDKEARKRSYAIKEKIVSFLRYGVEQPVWIVQIPEPEVLQRLAYGRSWQGRAGLPRPCPRTRRQQQAQQIRCQEPPAAPSPLLAEGPGRRPRSRARRG